MVPSAGGWRIDRSGVAFIPGRGSAVLGRAATWRRQPLRTSTFSLSRNRPGSSSTRWQAAVSRSHRSIRRRSFPTDDCCDRVGKARRRRARGPGAALPGRRDRAAAPIDRAASPDMLHVTVVNGDLTFEPRPLLLGHYHATLLTGTEKVMNTLIGDAMKRALDLGDYALSPARTGCS